MYRWASTGREGECELGCIQAKVCAHVGGRDVLRNLERFRKGNLGTYEQRACTGGGKESVDEPGVNDEGKLARIWTRRHTHLGERGVARNLE
jgi:hypothetical protein